MGHISILMWIKVHCHLWEFFKVGNINRKVNIIKAPDAGLEFIAYRFLVNVLTYGTVFCNKTRGMRL